MMHLVAFLIGCVVTLAIAPAVFIYLIRHMTPTPTDERITAHLKAYTEAERQSEALFREWATELAAKGLERPYSDDDMLMISELYYEIYRERDGS